MEHSRISHIFNSQKLRKPSDRCFMIAIPMFMYRIETCAFSDKKINFFQKAVLKLKMHPDVDNQTIAELISVDETLVKRVEDELIQKGFLYPQNGRINEKGRQALDNIDEILFDNNDRQIGYIFSYDDGKTLFPAYQTCNSVSSVLPHDRIIEKNNPFIIKEEEDVNPVKPSEQEILNCIKRSYGNESENSKINTNNLKIRFISKDESVDKVIVYTYVYLEKDDDSNLYSNDWYVLDPFSGEKSSALQFYLKSKKGKQLGNILDEKFGDAETTFDQTFNEINEQINEKVKERTNTDYGGENFKRLSNNIQGYLTSIIESLIRASKEVKQDHLQLIFSNFQKIIEAILLIDQEKRDETYSVLKENIRDYSIDEKKMLVKDIFRARILSDSQMEPYFNNKLINNLDNKSLKTYLLKFIMSIRFENSIKDVKLIPVFRNRIDKIIDIADARNKFSHGSKNNEHLEEYTVEKIDENYEFIKNLINDYIKTL